MQFFDLFTIFWAQFLSFFFGLIRAVFEGMIVP